MTNEEMNLALRIKELELCINLLQEKLEHQHAEIQELKNINRTFISYGDDIKFGSPPKTPIIQDGVYKDITSGPNIWTYEVTCNNNVINTFNNNNNTTAKEIFKK